MKKLLNYGSVVGIIAAVLFVVSPFQDVNAREKAEDPKVTCPSGDKYKCMQSPNGTIVFKGDGDTPVEF
jgi:hypothetical protein